MTILAQQALQHVHAAKDFDRSHQVTLIRRAMARACWDLTLHQSPAWAIGADCSEVEHARTHEVPHDMVCHVTSMHVIVHSGASSAAAVGLDSSPLAVTGGGASCDIMWSVVNNQCHTKLVLVTVLEACSHSHCSLNQPQAASDATALSAMVPQALQVFAVGVNLAVRIAVVCPGPGPRL